MIRPATLEDRKTIIAIAEAIKLFTPPELEELESMLAEYFEDDLDSDRFWIVYDDGDLVGVAYYAPEEFAFGTWNLYFIAVHPSRQGEAIGKKLLRYVEQTLAERGERILLVETSGLPNFERTRKFYRQNGYDEEARIREFYKAGDDKVIFRKALTVSK